MVNYGNERLYIKICSDQYTLEMKIRIYEFTIVLKTVKYHAKKIKKKEVWFKCGLHPEGLSARDRSL